MSQQINLFNPIFLKQKKYFSAVTMVQALGLILAGCALVVGYTQYQLKILADEANSTTAQLKTVQGQLSQAETLYGARQKSKELESDLNKTEAEVKALTQVFDILKKGEFGNTEGYAEYLRAFARQIVNGVWLTGVSIHGAGNEIALRGRTLQPDLVPAYITRLKREPVLQGKAFSTLEMQQATPAQNDKVNQSMTQPVMLGYIEFSLQSSGDMKDRLELSGVKTK